MFRYNPFTGKLDFWRRAIRCLLVAPTTPHEGEMYENALDDTIYIYYGGNWQTLHVLTSYSILMEDSDSLLQENGFRLILDT